MRLPVELEWRIREERAAAEAEEVHRQQLAAERLVADAELRTMNDQAAVRLKTAHAVGGASMQQWICPITEMLYREGWLAIPVGLDLGPAVTLTAAISAVYPVSPPVGYEVHTREAKTLGLDWALQDSLDGEAWHVLGQGHLSSAEPKSVLRLSSPLGTSARLSLRPRLMSVTVKSRDPMYSNHAYITGGRDTDGLVIANISAQIVIRTV